MTREELTPLEAETLAAIAPLLADDALWAQPDASLEQRVVADIGAEARGESTSIYRAVGSRSRAKRWLGAGVAAALGAAAAVAITLVVTRDQPHSPDASMAMVGTALAPDLSGSAAFTAMSSGVEIEIRMPGLPRRDGGEYYEVWMHDCAGNEWVPAGTFHDLEYVVAWAGVPAAHYPVLTVTRESAAPPTGDGQGSSGDVVAWGSLTDCPT